MDDDDDDDHDIHILAASIILPLSSVISIAHKAFIHSDADPRSGTMRGRTVMSELSNHSNHLTLHHQKRNDNQQ
jgi:hypothetical protein